jgi:Ras-related protein Ral-A
MRVKGESPDVPIILVGNKADLDQRQISDDKITALATKWNLDYVETSAKTKMNVDKIFYDLMTQIGQQKKTNSKPLPTKTNIKNRSLKKSFATFWKFLQGNCRTAK